MNNSPNQKYSGNIDLARRVALEEGITGFYKGITANLMRGVCQKGIYFYLYEIFKDGLFTSKSNPSIL